MVSDNIFVEQNEDNPNLSSFHYILCDYQTAVKSQDEVGTTNSFCINPIDLNSFFGDDGKIYGYKNLKVLGKFPDALLFF